MSLIKVNVGPLRNFNNLVYHLGPKLKEIRDAFVVGQTPDIVFDFKELSYGSISISGLTALLSSAKKLRDFLGHSIVAEIPWNQKVQGFLSDIGFFEISSKFLIFDFSRSNIGGYTIGSGNPNNKIIYFADIIPIKSIPIEDIGIIKAKHKQRIAPNFILRCSNIFDGFDVKLQSIITNTSLELIVNSLMHGEEISFVGLQRTSKRITVTVCDSGIGFPKSLSRTFPGEFKYETPKHIDAILFGCLAQKQQHGLRLAISEILNYDENDLFTNTNDGWVVISSFNTEIRWQKNLWGKAMENYEKGKKKGEKINVRNILGPPLQEYADLSIIENGYWKEYNSLLIGTRITFEIPIEF